MVRLASTRSWWRSNLGDRPMAARRVISRLASIFVAGHVKVVPLARADAVAR